MNVLSISGNLIKDPTLKTTQGGKSVCSFCIAVNKSKDESFLLNGVAWEKTGELMAEYLKKGNRLTCSGELDIRKYTDNKDGVEKYATEIIVRQFDFPPKTQGEPAKSLHGGMDTDEDTIPFRQLRNNEIFNY